MTLNLLKYGVPGLCILAVFICFWLLITNVRSLAKDNEDLAVKLESLTGTFKQYMDFTERVYLALDTLEKADARRKGETDEFVRALENLDQADRDVLGIRIPDAAVSGLRSYKSAEN